MGREECIQLLKKYMNILKNEYGITSLSLFGSTARGSQNPNSDIDLFVDTKTPNPFLLMDAKEFLENETGSSVDIVRNHQNLNPKLKRRILKDGILIFWIKECSNRYVDAAQILWIVKNEISPLKTAIQYFISELKK